MKLFPWDSHRFARFQIFDSASDFFIPRRLHRLVRTLKTVEEGVRQCRALIQGKSKGSF